MAGLLMTITDAGLDALVDAEGGGSDDIVIAELGLTDQIFVMAPTLTALPGEFKRLASISGEAVSDNIIHLTAYDVSPEIYDVTGFGLFLEDGTLFAAYSSDADPVLSKAALALGLFSLDVSFDNSAAANITFGTSIFSYPPASKISKGVAELADNGEADEGLDDLRIMTPKMVRRVIDAYAESVVNKIIPPRCPIAWYPANALDPVPTGWLLCDGTNGTPDLRDMFVVGAGGAFEVGDTGGSDTHGHDGAVEGHTLTIAETPTHRHLTARSGSFGAALAAGNSIGEQTTAGGDTEYILRGDAAEPNIGRTSEIGGGDAHAHGLSINDATTLPPYFALAYIMKA
ncbi:MAG: hypothetical protein QUV08_12515 [Parasphingorhabdus sp.]|nr:hypothetical protein [Parasphingorhabdus sp.]